MLKDKTVLITGGSRGIGAATAKAFAAQGVNVALIYAGNTPGAQAVAEACRDCGVQARIWKCDVADGERVKKTVGEIRDAFGSVDILVNNAGITQDGLIASMKEEAFTHVLDTNLLGAFHLIRQVSPLMLRNRWGRIVNVSSVAGLTGNAGQANYAASKAGLIGLTKSVARELASRGITCNAVAPGLIRTDMTRAIPPDNPLLASIPLGRPGQPEDVARAILFLADADYITGEVLRVDGGIAM